MSSIVFKKPSAGQQVDRNKEVTFEVEVSNDIQNVSFAANPNVPLAVAPVQGGKATLKQKFNTPGLRTVVARGLDGQNALLATAKINLQVGKPDQMAGHASQQTLNSIVASAHKLFNAGTATARRLAADFAGIDESADWCMAFCGVTYFRATGQVPRWGSSGFTPGRGRDEAWAPDMGLWAQENGFWLREKDIHKTSKLTGKALSTGDPKPGYLILYGDLVNMFGGSSRQNYPHIGIVVGVNGDTLTTIEGNAGDPGAVRMRNPHRSTLPDFGPGGRFSRYIAGYIIPPEPVQ